MPAMVFAVQPGGAAQSLAASRNIWAGWPAPAPRTYRRQRRPRPPAACAASAGNSAAQPRHFMRPSLLATGFREPQHVVQHCLALFRKADLAGLQQYLPDARGAAVQAGAGASPGGGGGSSPPAIPVGPVRVEEEGPLASLAGLLDVGARRVLPGHLLRRSQVLSTLRPGPDTFQQRVSLTAKSGETSVFDWLLRWQPEEAAAGGDSGVVGQGTAAAAAAGAGTGAAAESGSRGRWVLESVRRDASTDWPPPSTPHPSAAPEAIVKAQLAALAAGDVFEASCYSMWHSPAHLSSRRTSLGSHHDALRAVLAQQPHCLLLGHSGARLGATALRGRQEQLQEVAVLGADGSRATFVWRLSLATHGCWMASGIFAADELARQQDAGRAA